MLGLAIFVRAIEPVTSGAIFGVTDSNGRTILSAGLTMALLVLPILIINAQEAIRAVPNSLREASYGLGATHWQTIWYHVLPYALPGILTGTILAISRAIGETAPLIVVGASTFITKDPTSVFSKFTALPIQIYNWTSRPQTEFHHIAAAAIIVLLITLLSMNAAAIFLRNRFSRRNLMNLEKPSDNPSEYAIEVRDMSFYYGSFRAVKNVSMCMERKKITAIIGPSGCGKSTVLRSFNRMNDFIPGTRVEGEILFHKQNIYDPRIDPVQIRRTIGMVFQKPNPFPKTIYENVAWGARINGFNGSMDDLVEETLQKAALWDEVKGILRQSALALSGGQQQRLCIARALAVEPEVILMDEPCSALDPIATLKIEDLMRELSKNYTIIIVTHNMQQAARASDLTAFFTMDEDRAGMMVEYGPTDQIFTNPHDQRTEDYITGRFG